MARTEAKRLFAMSDHPIVDRINQDLSSKCQFSKKCAVVSVCFDQ